MGMPEELAQQVETQEAAQNRRDPRRRRAIGHEERKQTVAAKPGDVQKQKIAKLCTSLVLDQRALPFGNELVALQGIKKCY